MSVDQTIQLAIRHHQAGRVKEAEALCRQILLHQSANPYALQVLGQISHQAGRHAEAVDFMRRVLETDRANPFYHSNLGAVLAAEGLLDDAVASLRCAIAIKPDFADACANLGNVLVRQGKLPEAVDVYRKAAELRPHAPESYYNLGNALHRMRRWDEAIVSYRRAIALRPDYAEAHNNLGSLFSENGRMDDGVAAFREALRIQPRHLEAMNNLAASLQEKGDLDGAIECYRMALRIKPDVRVAGNLILAQHLRADDDPRLIRAEVDRWNQAYSRPLAALRQPHENTPLPDRRLRIGYVSRDLNRAPVGRFLLPLLANHDRETFEIFGFSDVSHPDATTQRLRGHCDHWREIAGMSDEQLAASIRQDAIDVLVDLGMHTKGSRILLFARKPAPVQVCYLAYCSTTGLDAIEYRFTDAHLDPPPPGSGQAPSTGSGNAPNRDGSEYSEKSVWLQSYWCYEAPAEAGAVGPLPCAIRGHLTFGCLNNYCKVTTGTFELWCDLLRKVPTSRLMLHALEGDHRARARERAAATGIDPGRVEFINRLPSAKYFAQYNQIDIALDPFPYPGGTTTCDALWMGVPVVTLAGRTAVARGGVTILSNIGLPDLIAMNRAQYVEIAASLAGDRPRLAVLRSTLRRRMQSSPLMDAPRFARDVESAFRAMWRRWCESSRGLK